MAAPAAPPWFLGGNFMTGCNCDYFCPCMLSLGRARPTYGHCHGVFGFEVERGQFDDLSLDSLGVAMAVAIPGPMAEGNWTAALYLDERASPAQHAALTRIFSGKAGGPIGWFDLVIARLLGPKTVPIRFGFEGERHQLEIPGILETVVQEEPGRDGKAPVKIVNSRYWISDEVVVGRVSSARYQDHGFNWQLQGTSGEITRFSWKGP